MVLEHELIEAYVFKNVATIFDRSQFGLSD